jgi:type II secretory pathway component PulL
VSEAKVKTAKVKAKRRWRARHLVSAVIALIVVCGGAYAIVVWHSYQSSKPAVNAANSFLNSLETNNVADAYTQLCSATKKQFSEAQFATYVKTQPGIDGHSSTSVELSTVNGTASAIVTEDIKNTGGSSQSRSIVLNKENGSWLVCGSPY